MPKQKRHTVTFKNPPTPKKERIRKEAIRIKEMSEEIAHNYKVKKNLY